jgi:hypothetical protein
MKPLRRCATAPYRDDDSGSLRWRQDDGLESNVANATESFGGTTTDINRLFTGC